VEKVLIERHSASQLLGALCLLWKIVNPHLQLRIAFLFLEIITFSHSRLGLKLLVKEISIEYK